MITLITTYFEDPRRLKEFIEKQFDENFYSELIIVDDGSPLQPAEPIVMKYPDKNIRLFRVKSDIGFNSHGARNLAMKHVDTEWAYMTDIDRDNIGRFAPVLDRYVRSAYDNEYFNFLLGMDHYNSTDVTHNDYCVRTKDWWRTGGYDEEFVNWHFGDRIFIERLNSYLTPTTIPVIIKATRKGRKWVETDTGITTYPNDETVIHPTYSKEYQKKLIDLVGWRNDNPELWVRDNIINFEWEQVV